MNKLEHKQRQLKLENTSFLAFTGTSKFTDSYDQATQLTPPMQHAVHDSERLVECVGRIAFVTLETKLRVGLQNQMLNAVTRVSDIAGTLGGEKGQHVKNKAKVSRNISYVAG